MKNSTQFLTAFLIFSTLFFSIAHAGSEGNGGGGIVRDGQFLTFGSAKVILEPQTTNMVPGLSLLIWALKQMPLYDTARWPLMKAVQPVGKRTYFAIPSNQLSAETRTKLIEEYRKALGNAVVKENLVVFAFTKNSETFLLPEFFSLNRIQQATVLFHEGLWNLNPNAPYDAVIKLEMLFQNYLDANLKGGNYILKYDFALVDAIGRFIEDPVLPVLTAANIDITQKKLSSNLFRSDGRILFSALFGENSFYFKHWGDKATVEIFETKIFGHLSTLIEKNPESKLLPTLLEMLDRIEFKVYCPSAIGYLRDFDPPHDHQYKAEINNSGISPWGYEMKNGNYFNSFYLNGPYCDFIFTFN